MTETPKTRNITKLFRTATDAEILAGIEWYDDAHRIAEILAYRYDVRIEKTAGVIAALSPLQSWGANVNLATRVVNDWNEGITTTAGYLSLGLDKAARILAADERTDSFEYNGEIQILTLTDRVEAILQPKPTSGDKVVNFFRSILSSGKEGVCVDRHAWSLAVNVRYAEGSAPKVAGKRYDDAVTAYTRATKILRKTENLPDLTPAQVQAVTWTLWRRKFWSEGAFDGTAGQFASELTEKVW